MILTVGRLGTAQKNTLLLLYAYALAFLQLKEPWDLVMVGSVTPEFQSEYEEFCRRFPARRCLFYCRNDFTADRGNQTSV